jgi:hypothetical protein
VPLNPEALEISQSFGIAIIPKALLFSAFAKSPDVE